MRNLAEVEQAKENAKEQLDRAHQADRWMVAVWRIEDGNVLVERTTWQFPHNDFNTALGELQKELQEELRPTSQALPAIPKGALPPLGIFNREKGNNSN